MKVVGVLGSCATQAATHRSLLAARAVRFSGRTSFVSLTSAPIETSAIQGWRRYLDEYEWRHLIRDFDRAFWDEPIETYDLLIIDLISEHRDLLEKDGRYALSNHVIEAAHPRYADVGFRVVRRDEARALQLWFDAARRFFERLAARLPLSKVVVHRAYWAARFADPSYEPPRPWWREGDAVAFHNAQLDAYYEHIVRTYGIETIAARPELSLMEPRHPYGEAPYHYVAAYHEDLAGQLAARLARG